VAFRELIAGFRGFMAGFRKFITGFIAGFKVGTLLKDLKEGLEQD